MILAKKKSPSTHNTHDLAVAHRVIALEIEGLSALQTHIDHHFSDALDWLVQTTGRVIVTGMGKSGHIARKFAATLSSTGTAAVFVHPAEASHGDLGMITPNDAVIALSNSGETPELLNIFAYCRRFSIPLIALTSAPNSTLAQHSHVAIITPKIQEACPMGLAPTTSTTIMLALCDALAVALIERRAFTPEEFGVYHPGGKLGNRLLKVQKIMHTGIEIPVIHKNAALTDALLEMTGKSFGCVGVVDDDNVLVGVVTDGDLRRHMSPNLLNFHVLQVMTPSPKTIGPNHFVVDALNIMNQSKITNIFVVDEQNHPVGILHVHDCLRAGAV